ncbi:MAG: glycine/sarcosine/betaine reductase selenoprotein B family protein [Anaerolineales bacterium]|jgi:D-proline reductase (dithiol) PrdB
MASARVYPHVADDSIEGTSSGNHLHTVRGMKMDVLENRDRWYAEYKNGWLAHFEQTGELDWDRYHRPTNKEVPAGPGLDLSEARLVLISTAGGYLEGRQEPYDAANPLGDYSLRTFPTSTPFEQIAFAHEHYDHRAVNEDPQVLLPLRHLEQLSADGQIGGLSDSVISLMGYQPDVTRTLDETIPAVISTASELDADAALLVPS